MGNFRCLPPLPPKRVKYDDFATLALRARECRITGAKIERIGTIEVQEKIGDINFQPDGLNLGLGTCDLRGFRLRVRGFSAWAT